MIRKLAGVLLIPYLFSCGPGKKPVEKEPTDNKVRNYYSDGKLKSEVSMKDGFRDGLSKTFYADGKVSLEINYSHGKREGKAKRYYASGNLYQETEYKDDKIEGIRKKFHENGKLMAEERYVKDFTCKGLKEYGEDGKPKENNPKVSMKAVDKLKNEGDYFLILELTNESKRVVYYEGRLTAEGCLHKDLIPIPVDKKTGKGRMSYHLFPGGFKMEEVHTVAVWQTGLGSDYITEAVYHLSIEN